MNSKFLKEVKNITPPCVYEEILRIMKNEDFHPAHERCLETASKKVGVLSKSQKAVFSYIMRNLEKSHKLSDLLMKHINDTPKYLPVTPGYYLVIGYNYGVYVEFISGL